MPNGICKLCDKKAYIVESHVIPKSIYRWIKDTSGTGILRGGRNINIPRQDGFKYYWLCNDCEQKFGKYEKYFVENIFKPVNNGVIVSEFKYDDRLFYFLSSVWWRLIHQSFTEADVQNCKFIDQIKCCEQELKCFLDTLNYPLNFDQNYLLLLGEIQNAPKQLKNLNSIFLRTVDPLLMFDDDSCYLSLRIPHFYFFGNILGLKTDMLNSIKLNPSGGHFKVDRAPLKEPHIASLISQRITAINGLLNNMSAKQTQKTTERHLKHKEKWYKSKSYFAWFKDKTREQDDDD